jgi:hypothetical protein
VLGLGHDVEAVILMLQLELLIATIDITSIDAIATQQSPPEGRLAVVIFPCGFSNICDAI